MLGLPTLIVGESIGVIPINRLKSFSILGIALKDDYEFF